MRRIAARLRYCRTCKKKTVHLRKGSLGSGVWWVCARCHRETMSVRAARGTA